MLCQAKSIHDGSKVTGYFVKDHLNKEQIYVLGSQESQYIDIIPGSACRFTGLEVSGKKLWESDVVTYEGVIGVVRFGLYNDKHYGFYVDWKDNYVFRRDIYYWLPFINVIGNEKID